MARVRPGMSACIETDWSMHSQGYGVRYDGKVAVLAHRDAWERTFGPLPPGACVLHSCDNRRCINAAHLFLGTRGDNARDRHAKGRDARGEDNGQARLTVAQVKAIRADPRSQYVIAIAYGVSQQHVSDIKAGRRWAHV
jgi:hypothetical protein